MQKESESNVRKEFKSKVNEFTENLQQEVQSTFKNIDAKLDQFLNDEFSQSKKITTQFQHELPKVNYNILLKLQEDNFPKQINQEVTSLIKNNIQKNQIQKKIISQNIQSNPLNIKPFTYQLVYPNSIKQDQYCYAIAVNQDSSILIAGCNQEIKVFEFKQGILKQIQILTEHERNVWTLNFMKRSDQFISGSQDKKIIIWKRNLNNSWDLQQKLNEHTGGIVCLLLNNNEDIIVAGDNNYKIKFWQKQNEWVCSQTITDHTKNVQGLSFNEQQNRLISCGDDNFILIIEQSEENKSWIVVQKITVEQFGFRICFIDNNTFTFQPKEKQYINIFEMNNTNKQYIKTNNIPVKGGTSDDCFFAQQYIKSKCILVNKHDSFVSLTRKKQNGEFIIEESIDFGTKYIFGCMTDDGQYLITWDIKSKEIQIRKYQEKQ